MSETRVLVVDDEVQIQRFLKPALTSSGYQVTSVGTGGEALRLIAAGRTDIVLLDLGLPDLDGKEVLRQVRAFSKIPIIVLSAREREAEKIDALDLGADDYVEKPFAIGELMARMRTALRHLAEGASEETRVEFGGLVVDTLKRYVAKNGEPVKLTPKEYDLLAILARHAGRVLTHRQILAGVWGPAHTDDTQYLRVFIGQLRAKIEDDPTAPKIISTEPGVGYRFLESET